MILLLAQWFYKSFSFFVKSLSGSKEIAEVDKLSSKLPFFLKLDFKKNLFNLKKTDFFKFLALIYNIYLFNNLFWALMIDNTFLEKK